MTNEVSPAAIPRAEWITVENQLPRSQMNLTARRNLLKNAVKGSLAIRLGLSALFGSALLSAATSARAQTMSAGVFFDEFFTDHLSMPGDNIPGNNTATPPTGFVNWSVTGGSVDLVGGVIPAGLQPNTGGRFVDLGGSTGQAGLFATNPGLNFLPGITYTLSFLYVSTGTLLNAAAPTMETARVTIGSLSFDVSTSSGTFQPFSRDFSFATLTSAPLTFQDQGTDNAGLGIDRVMVMPAVPEPGSFALLGVGALLGFGAAWRSRRQSALPRAAARTTCRQSCD